MQFSLKIIQYPPFFKKGITILSNVHFWSLLPLSFNPKLYLIVSKPEKILKNCKIHCTTTIRIIDYHSNFVSQEWRKQWIITSYKTCLIFLWKNVYVNICVFKFQEESFANKYRFRRLRWDKMGAGSMQFYCLGAGVLRPMEECPLIWSSSVLHGHCTVCFSAYLFGPRT